MTSFLNGVLQDAVIRSSASDWKYVAEGALNIALRYDGGDPVLCGRVLRLRKRNRKASFAARDGGSPWNESLQFADNLLVPLLGRRYVHTSIPAALADGFVNVIGDSIEKQRPEHRLMHPLDENVKEGLLMTDCSRLVQGYGPSFCFEVKLKCGFVPSSCPFVTSDVKRQVDRFTMHQQLKLAEGHISRVSEYSPPDLFSYDVVRVRRAIQALVAEPQNNLRLFADGRLIFPVEGDDLHSASEPYFVPGSCLTSLVGALAQVFLNEPLLARVERMQRLDDCDIEGAFEAYSGIIKRGETLAPLASISRPLLPRTPPLAYGSGATSAELRSGFLATPDEQHETLHRFLVAATAKDCSAMIVFRWAGSDPQSDVVSIPSRESEPESEKGDKFVGLCDGWYYSAALVDLDPKPVDKMPGYRELDRQVVDMYLQSVAEKTNQSY